MTLEFEHENDPLPCCPYCGMYDNEIFTKVENLLFGSYVCFHHECPGCEARYAVRFYPPRHTGFNTGFLENERHAFKDADPQKPADQGEGIDRPSTVKTDDVSEPREYDTSELGRLLKPFVAEAGKRYTPNGTTIGSMPNSVPTSTPGDDSANAAEGTQLAEAFAVDIYRQYCWREFMDIDSGDFQEMLKKHGLIEEYTVTHEQVVAEEAPEECEAGDLAFRPTPYFRALLGQNQ